MTATERYAPLAGRIFLSLTFIISGFGKLAQFTYWSELMHTFGIPAPGFFLVSAIFIELAGGVCLLLGFRARIAAAVLVAFSVMAMLMFHQFWAADDARSHLEFIEFTKNLAIIGGLLLIVGLGSGAYSIDKRSP